MPLTVRGSLITTMDASRFEVNTTTVTTAKIIRWRGCPSLGTCSSVRADEFTKIPESCAEPGSACRPADVVLRETLAGDGPTPKRQRTSPESSFESTRALHPNAAPIT